MALQSTPAATLIATLEQTLRGTVEPLRTAGRSHGRFPSAVAKGGIEEKSNCPTRGLLMCISHGRSKLDVLPDYGPRDVGACC